MRFLYYGAAFISILLLLCLGGLYLVFYSDLLYITGKQHAIHSVQQRYPTAQIIDVVRVNKAWGEGPGQWSILFEVEGQRYCIWYSIDGSTQIDWLSLGPGGR